MKNASQYRQTFCSASVLARASASLMPRWSPMRQVMPNGTNTEFANDAYVSWKTEHFFNGFIFNKIPLFKRLNLREVITFKGVWGNLSDKNNPLKNPGLIQFINNEDGRQQTFTLESKPFMEASAGR